MANIKHIAQLCGVSASTVSNVFTNRKPVSAKTREKVLEVSRQLHYAPSVMAAANITKRTDFIGFFFDTNNSNFSSLDSDMIKGCTIAAAEFGKRLIVYYNLKDKYELQSALRTGCQPLDGAVMILPQFHDFRLDPLQDSAIPYVLIGSPATGDRLTSYVDADNDNIAYAITERLIQLGHRRIAMINYKEGYSVTEHRMAGYVRAMNEYGLQVPWELIRYEDMDKAAGIRVAARLMEENRFFSAALVSMPEVAAGFYQTLEQRGLAVGEDISIASFNTDHSGLCPELSSSRLDYESMGRQAVYTLRALMEHPEQAPYQHIEPIRLHFTDSCRPLSVRLPDKWRTCTGLFPLITQG